MKKLNRFLRMAVIPMILLSGCQKAAEPSSENSVTVNPVVGMAYQGGIVAYVLQAGDPGYISGAAHGFIVATSDQSIGVRWSNGTDYSIPGAKGTALGTGQANTTAIVNSEGAGSYAAQVCNDYTNEDTGTGVYSDWYLPSSDELNKVYLNQATIGVFPPASFYWSSYEVVPVGARVQKFSDGTLLSFAKDLTPQVRCMRSF